MPSTRKWYSFHIISYSLEQVALWSGLQLKFSFFFGSVIFKKAGLQVLKMLYLKILKRLPLNLIRNWILRRCAHRSHVLSSFLSDSEASLLLKKQKNWASLLISRHVTLSTNVKDYSLTVYSPLWGCARDQVEMVVKVHCGTVLGDEFAAMLKMHAQNSPTMHFDNHHDSVSRATSNWRIA